ncbi:hypothetical protein AVEN_243790-1 [Araneus ventricosus]|uniref:Uncharacterized protein n=1 Tax=Araneus ventricosus TaxID=182803 RepID=A0A4Y2A5B8_ARAVE|nr:hypothetical protein AVEN_243790-1 [Araneus ventricosus]
MNTVFCIVITVKAPPFKITLQVQEVVVRRCEVGAVQWMIELLPTELLNKVLSDTSRMGTCIVKKQHNTLTEHSSPFVLNCTPQFSQCFTVSYRIDGSTSGKELHKQNGLSVPDHSAHDFVCRQRCFDFFGGGGRATVSTSTSSTVILILE